MSKTSKILAGLYILFCVFSFFYVRNVLKSENVRQKREEDVDIEEVYKIDITLNYYDGSSQKQLSEVMKNTDDIMNFLNELRQRKKIVFEKIEYTYGTEIESVNGVLPKEGYKWAIIEDGKDITLDIENIKVPKDGNLDLRIIQDIK